MPLRPELLYRSPRPARAEAFLHRALEIAALAEVGLDTGELLAEFNRESGRDWRPEAFLFMLRGGDLPALAVEAATPLPEADDLSDEELVALLELIRASEPPEAGYYIDLFERAVGRPEAAALMFWPPDKWAWRKSRRKLAEWQPSDKTVLELAAVPA